MNRCVPIAILCLLSLLAGSVHGQEVVNFNGHRVLPDRNLPALHRGGSVSQFDSPYLLVQFDGLPNAAARRLWQDRGLTLQDYLGANAFLATYSQGEAFRHPMAGGVRMLSAMPIASSWKEPLGIRSGQIPQWARVGQQAVRLVVYLHSDADFESTLFFIRSSAKRVIHSVKRWSMVEVEIALDAVGHLSAHSGVKLLAWPAPPAQVLNSGARILNGSSVLGLPQSLQGRGLTGSGVRVGIWDADVALHPDLGGRVRRLERERGNEELHGTHVAGTVLGSGMVNPDFCGMAPKARAWSFNFGEQRNGLPEALEMLYGYEDLGIRITQNSYGIPLVALCENYHLRGYSTSDYALDLLTQRYPRLVHVFAAGNSQRHCPDVLQEKWGAHGYGSATSHAKNVVYVGAVDNQGRMSDFSSFGPLADGRLFPTICAKGVAVHSVSPGASYAPLDGTSMACPVVSGTFAQIAERWHQLHQGEDIRHDLLRAASANTAKDAGRPGPDFEYGYGVFDGEKTLQLLERGWYAFGRISHQGSAEHRVSIPANSGPVRVMLVWNDTVSANAPADQKALINNVDLTVDHAGKEYLPLVCDPRPGHVRDNAKPGVDALNTIEQVLVPGSGEASELRIVVRGTEIASHGQEYVVVWWYEMPEAPSLLLPSGAEALVAGRAEPLVLRGVPSEGRIVEVSFDGGKSYESNRLLAKQMGMPDYSDTLIYIPSDRQSAECLVRISVSKLGLSLTSAPLRVAPRVGNAHFSASTTCRCESLTLAWEAVASARDGYTIYRIDPERELVQEIGHTKELEYAIAADAKANGYYYAVAVRFGNGQTGPRSVAIRPDLVSSYSLASGADTVAEIFREPSSPNYQISLGRKTSKRWVSSPHYGGHALIFTTAVTHPEGYSAEDTPFDAPNYATHVGRLDLCGIDLRGNSAEPVVMDIEGLLKSSLGHLDQFDNVRFRVLSNGEPIPDASGRVVQLASRTELGVWRYFLKPNVDHQLRIEYMGTSAGDSFVIERIQFHRVRKEYDFSLVVLSQPADGARLGRETFALRLSHLGSKKAESAVVYAYVNGHLDSSSAIYLQDWEPQTIREIVMPVDLSTENPFGLEQKVEFVVQHGVARARAQARVQHRGDVILHPFSDEACILGGCIPVDPLASVRMARAAETFTDYGGMLGNYPQRQKSTLRIYPNSNGARLRATFQEVELAEGDELWIYTQDIPADLEKLSAMPTYRFVGPCKKGGVFVSDDTSGAIVFQLRSFNTVAKGWVAHLDEVLGANALTLMRADHQVRSAEPEGEIALRVLVRNNLLTPVSGVQLRLVIAGQDTIGHHVDRMGLGENIVEFGRKIEAKQGYLRPATLHVQSAMDTEGGDNRCDLLLGYDRYRFAPLLMKGAPLQLRSVRLADGQEIFLYREGWYEVPHMAIQQPISMYDATGYSASVSLGAPMPDDGFLTYMVDRDDDGEWAENEVHSVPIQMGEESVVVDFGLSAGSARSSHRVRLLLGAEKATLSNMSKPGFWYDVWDIQLDRSASLPPYTGDLSVAGISLGRSGLDLAADQPIKVKLANHSYMPFNGKVQYELLLDGQRFVGEMDCAAHPLAPYGGVGEYELSQRGDFRAKGWHVAEIRIKEQPVEVNEANNTASTRILSIVPVDGLPKAVFLPEATHEANYIHAVSAFGNLIASGALSDLSNLTLEMWIRPAAGLAHQLAYDEGSFKLVMAYGMAQEGVPDYALGVEVGRRGAMRYTLGAAVVPNAWNHVAYVLEDGVDALYVNGVKQELEAGAVGALSLSNMLICHGYAGGIDMIRVWNVPRNSAALRETMYKELRKEVLPAECLLEFAFDEGAGNYLATSGRDAHVSIGVQEPLLNDPINGVWRGNGDLLEGLRCEPGYIERTGGSTYSLYVPADITAVQLFASLPWREAKAICNGVALENGMGILPLTATEFDLKVSIPEFFGRADYDQTFQIQLHRTSLGGLRSLLLPMSDNAGLKADIPLAVKPTVEVQFGEGQGALETLSDVAVRYELSDPNLKLQVGGEEVSGGTIRIDLRHPVLFTVLNPSNGVAGHYWLRLPLRPQQIENFALRSESYVFGDAPEPLLARSSSGLPVTYVSSDPSVAVVSEGKLHVVGVGKAVITAQQLGNAMYSAAPPISLPVEVIRKSAIIKPKEAILEYGQEYHLELAYEGLVSEQHGELLSYPAVRFLDPAGRVYEPHGDLLDVASQLSIFLPLGEYTVQPLEASYQTDRYSVNCQPGRLVVGASAKLAHLQLAVVSAQGQALADVRVEVDGRPYITDAQGEVHIAVARGKGLHLRASMSGYAEYRGAVLADSAHVAKRVVLQVPHFYTVRYTAGSGGSIVGLAEQRVARGAQAHPVMAVAAPQYHFAKWSDGVVSSQRQENDLQADVELAAEFTRRTCRVSYALTEGGRLNSGQAEQIVMAGEDAESVAVEALPGYEFLGWDDGQAASARRDMGVMEDIRRVAQFGKVRSIPYEYGFEDADFAQGWYSRVEAGSEFSIPWEQSSKPLDGVSLDKGFALCWSGKLGLMWGRMSSYLYSPGLNLAGQTEDLRIAFDYIFTAFQLGTTSETVSVEYSFDRSSWDYLGQLDQQLPLTQVRKQAFYTLSKPQYAGQSTLYIRLNLTTVTGYHVLVDNFQVFPASATTTLTFETIPAGAGSFVDPIAGTPTPSALERGSVLPAVKVIPAAGKYFVGWEDGSTANPRSFGSERAMQPHVYRALLADEGSYPISLRVYPVGAGTVLINGQETGSGLVSMGAPCVIEAKAQAGYRFARWSDNSSADFKRELNNLSAPFSAVAIFEPQLVRAVLTVQEGQKGVPGALVEIGDSKCAADADGKVVMLLQPGKHRWQIHAAGYASQSGLLTISEESEQHHTLVMYRPFYAVQFSAQGKGRLEGELYQLVPFGASTLPISAVGAEGYAVIWSDGVDGASRIVPDVRSDMQIEGKFIPIRYTLIYHANGAEGAMAPQELEWDTPARLSLNAFNRPGYTFVGWSKQQAGKPEYSDGQEVINLRNMPGEVTLFAQWIEEEGTDVVSQRVAVVEVQPNPVQDGLRCHVPGGCIVRIYSVLGSLLTQSDYVDGGEIDCRQLSPGIYVLRIYTEDGYIHQGIFAKE